MHADFATLGNISIDDLVFVDGSTKWCVPGGNAVYSGLGMAVWDERPAIIAPIGPEYPVADLGGRIDLSNCRQLLRNLRNWGLYEEDGSRHFIFRTATGNWHEFSPTLSDLDGFTCGNALLAPMPWTVQIELAERLRHDGTTLIGVDTDDRHLREVDRPTLKRLLDLLDLFLPSKQDAEAMVPGKSPPDALRVLREMAPELPVIAIKCGDKGVIMHAAGQADYLEIPTVAKTVVDATGAGDAFSGGTLVGLARTGKPLDAVLWGSVSASFAVAGLGPTALVGATKHEAQCRLDHLRTQVDAHRL
ncbi:MAG: PfkB domain protein [Devosia sp.]|uniref:carbohydrate kinase family protein n=1 Tax=Devosia sp. TaxID=1871048 RepID=UPI002636A2EE|nr:carbohydrate kinase family protein [Devosia sp.]MDB5586275.1 PfkB domain protein [Devosia sp.]